MSTSTRIHHASSRVANARTSPVAPTTPLAEVHAIGPTTTRLIPVSRWNDHHDWPPPGGLRHLIFHAETNGFATAFKRVGRRVLVDEAEFFRSVDRANKR